MKSITLLSDHEADVLQAIHREAQRAVLFHGEVTDDPCRVIANLTKELGEAAQEVTKMTSRSMKEREGRNDPEEKILPVTREDRLARIAMELVQVAAYCYLVVMKIEQGGYRD